jgi:hypothetical protein
MDGGLTSTQDAIRQVQTRCRGEAYVSKESLPEK